MTKLLEMAFAEAAKLPEATQDLVATQLLRELADDARWDASFAASASQLEQMAAEALEEYRSGRTEELGFDEPELHSPRSSSSERRRRGGA